MLFNNKQLQIIKFQNKIKPWLMIQEGTIRTGKSILNNWLFLMHVFEFRDMDLQFIITGKNQGTIERNVLTDMKKMFGVNTRTDKYNSFKLLGNTIRCFGTDTKEAYENLAGFTAFGWLGNEVTYSEPEALKEAFGRCSGDGARIFWDCNPEAPDHIVKQNYIDKADQKTIASFHWVMEDNSEENNGFLSRQYIDNLKTTTPAGVWYDRKILGLWTSAEGMIYKDWNPSTMILDQLPEMKRYFAGVDWGFEHIGVIVVIGQDHDGNYYLVEEIAQQHRNIDWWLEQKKRIIIKYGLMPFYCDSARPEYVSAFRGIEANKAVIEGIEYVAGLIKKNRFYIARTQCPQFEKEIYLYQWDSKVNKEAPKKENDDALDAIRYALYTDNRKHIDINKTTVQSITIRESFDY